MARSAEASDLIRGHFANVPIMPRRGARSDLGPEKSYKYLKSFRAGAGKSRFYPPICLEFAVAGYAQTRILRRRRSDPGRGDLDAPRATFISVSTASRCARGEDDRWPFSHQPGRAAACA